MSKILLVDDDPQALESTRKILELAGHAVTCATDGQMALELVRASGDYDLVVTDVRMPRLGGLEFLRAMALCGDHLPVILMTAFGRVEDAVWAMKFGAVDFLTKPFKRQTLLQAVDLVLKRGHKNKMGAGARESSQGAGLESQLIGASEVMRQLRSDVVRVAESAATVLITGESGTGKDLVARTLHQVGARSAHPFVALNCAAVPEQLIESELFGFEKGAFTGASGTKDGLFESAHRGTLLLDEIGEMPLPLQAKLLRVLQEGEVRRLGATASKKVDVRVIAATNRDLHEAVRAGVFRQDLLYRLEVIGIRVPALRERIVDLPSLALHFLSEAERRHEKKTGGISRQAMEVMSRHAWPGNVRELWNVIERAVVFARGLEITVADLPPHLVVLAGGSVMEKADPKSTSKIEISVGTPLKDIEELMIRKTLEATDGDKNMTARLLGINSRTIYRKLDGK